MYTIVYRKKKINRNVIGIVIKYVVPFLLVSIERMDS